MCSRGVGRFIYRRTLGVYGGHSVSVNQGGCHWPDVTRVHYLLEKVIRQEIKLIASELCEMAVSYSEGTALAGNSRRNGNTPHMYMGFYVETSIDGR